VAWSGACLILKGRVYRSVICCNIDDQQGPWDGVRP
jgi:hypothetical protein